MKIDKQLLQKDGLFQLKISIDGVLEYFWLQRPCKETALEFKQRVEKDTQNIKQIKHLVNLKTTQNEK